MNTRRLRALIQKELLSYLRDPKSRITLVAPPLMQLLVFSFAATLEVKNVDIGVLDADTGRWSTEMTRRIEAASFVDAVVPLSSEVEARRVLDEREVLIVVDYPADFSRDIAAGRAGSVQVIVDGRRANAGQIALGYLEAIARTLSSDIAPMQATRMPENVVRHAFNPNLIYRWFIVPGLAGILAMFISLIVTALSIAREREMGTFEQLRVAPATPLEIVVGKTVPALIVGTTLGTLMICAGIFLFRIPFTGSFVLLLACLVLFILSVVGIGLMVSALCQTQQQAILGTFAIGVPVILISGFATPVENMPSWLQDIAQASPLTHFLVILHGSFLKAMPPSVVGQTAWPMAAIAVITLSAAVLLVRHKLA